MYLFDLWESTIRNIFCYLKIMLCFTNNSWSLWRQILFPTFNKIHLNDDSEENGEPSFSPEVVEDQTDQGVWRLK